MTSENRPLTAIRGVAAVWVVFHHLQPTYWPAAPHPILAALHMGHTGVDLFFVLSGFILAEVYRDLHPREAGGFWLRRLLRVYPLHLCVIGALAAWNLFNLLHAGHSDPWSTFLPSVFMLQSLFLTGTGWNPPSWSVGIELICYALFPLAIILLRRVRGLPAVLLVVAAAAAEFHVMRQHAAVIVGAGAVLRGLAGFTLGALLTRLPRPDSVGSAARFETLGIVILAAGIWLGDPALVPLGSAALILGLSAEIGPVGRLLSLGPLVWLGTISYSLYLVHAPLVGFVAALARRFPRLPFIPTVLVLLFAVAPLTYRMIEQPGRRLARRLQRGLGAAAAAFPAPIWRPLARSRAASLTLRRG